MFDLILHCLALHWPTHLVPLGNLPPVNCAPVCVAVVWADHAGGSGSGQGTQLSNISIASLGSLPPGINLQSLAGLSGVSLANLGLQHMQVSQVCLSVCLLNDHCLSPCLYDPCLSMTPVSLPVRLLSVYDPCLPACMTSVCVIPIWPLSTCVYDPWLIACMAFVYLSVWPLSTCLCDPCLPVYDPCLFVWPLSTCLYDFCVISIWPLSTCVYDPWWIARMALIYLSVWPLSTCLYDPCLPVCMTPVYLPYDPCLPVCMTHTVSGGSLHCQCCQQHMQQHMQVRCMFGWSVSLSRCQSVANL